MKAKVILTSTAVLGMLTACSQDELDVLEANAPAEVAARPVAGKAVIKVGEQTRFNNELGAFEEGDQIGLYLMDNFVGEYWDANETPFMNKTVWQSMLAPTDQIHTNYLYEKKGAEFVNPGTKALVEGNYFLFYDPECSNNPKAYRNQRELWKAISSTLELNDYTATAFNPETKDGKWAGLYGSLGNQFYLDYAQIYRDYEAVNADGELVIDAELKAIMGKYKIDVINQSAHKYRIKEIRIKPGAGYDVPNIAWVKPKTNNLYTVIDPAYNGGSLYPNGKKTFTQAMARALVTYGQAGVSGPIPYGYEGETETAPYYTVKFPESAIIDVHSGPITLQSGLEAIFVAPELGVGAQFVVYADQYDPFVVNPDGTKGVWVPGYFEKFLDHGEWYLEDCIKSGETNTGRLAFDDYAFTKFSAIAKVQSTQDLFDKVKATLAKGWVAEIQAELDGDGVEINNALNDMINEYETTYGKQVVVKILKKGHDITIADENLLTSNNFDLSVYNKGGVPAIVLKADQKLAATMVGKNIKVPAGQTINLDLNGQKLGYVTNAGTINVTGEGVLNGENNGTIKIAEGATVESHDLINNNKMYVDGKLREYTENPSSIVNNGYVCVGDNAEVTITKGSGWLDVTNVTVKGDGLQNHIEVVTPDMQSIVYKTSEGDLTKLSKTLKTILAAHILTDCYNPIEVTTTAPTLTGSMDAAIAAKLLLVCENAVTIVPVAPSTVLDLSNIKDLEFNGGLTVKAGHTLKTKNATVAGDVIVQANATIEDAGSFNVDGATINLYENALLKASLFSGAGTIYGYDAQIDDVTTLPTGIVVKGHI